MALRWRVSFAAIGVSAEGDQFRIRVKRQPHGPWQDWLDGRLCCRLEAVETLRHLGLECSRAEQLIEFALTRGTPAPRLHRPNRVASVPTAPTARGRAGLCPSCEVPALASSPDGIGYFCLACGFVPDSEG